MYYHCPINVLMSLMTDTYVIACQCHSYAFVSDTLTVRDSIIVSRRTVICRSA
jgi:hypothetical protein